MSERSLRALIVALGLVQLGAGCWIAFATKSFGQALASFHGFNAHDLRDFATFYLALGIALLVAANRPQWRLPILALAALEYGFHAINHALDIAHSDPAWIGPTELAALSIATALFAWLAQVAAPGGPRLGRDADRSAQRTAQEERAAPSSSAQRGADTFCS